MRRVKVSALIAITFISFLSTNVTATAGCCGTWDGRGGEWVWRPVGWNWYGGLMWRAEGWGAPVWGYQTCYRPRRILTPEGWVWHTVRVC
jgi:hypothetical protein